MQNHVSTLDTLATPALQDVPGVDELGKDLSNGGGVVKIDSDLPNGHLETNGQNQKEEQREPSDDEDEEEQPETVETEEIGSKDMYLDAVSNSQNHGANRS